MKQIFPTKRVKINGNIWTIHIVPPTHIKLGKTRDGHANYGRCWLEDKKIYINNRLRGKNYKWTILHEIMHAFHYEIGKYEKLVEKTNNQWMENFVDSLSLAMIPLIKSNLFKRPTKKGRTRV